jgi:hypothetical protein
MSNFFEERLNLHKLKECRIHLIAHAWHYGFLPLWLSDRKLQGALSPTSDDLIFARRQIFSEIPETALKNVPTRRIKRHFWAMERLFTTSHVAEIDMLTKDICKRNQNLQLIVCEGFIFLLSLNVTFSRSNLQIAQCSKSIEILHATSKNTSTVMNRNGSPCVCFCSGCHAYLICLVSFIFHPPGFPMENHSSL